jgi:hypothetical protein
MFSTSRTIDNLERQYQGYAAELRRRYLPAAAPMIAASTTQPSTMSMDQCPPSPGTVEASS